MRGLERRVDVDLQALAEFDTIIDVRSPAEFALDHVPGSVNHPVLDDDERAEVGTLYVQVSPFLARRRGAVLVARNIARHIEASFAGFPREWHPLVMCWRGGQRSDAMTHVLRSVGWNAVQLPGGYKRWRSHVIAALERLPQTLRYRVICGPTGSGKSRLLQALRQAGAQVLDLEALAAHRGSVLGALPGQAQPAQRLFESLLLRALEGLDPQRPVFVEAESRRIGSLRVPQNLIIEMHGSPCLRIEAAESARVALLLDEYRHFLADLPALGATLERLTELHGRARIGQWMALAQAGNFAALVEDLLRTHYDPHYRRSSENNYAALADAGRLEGGGLKLDDFERLARELRDVQ
jgi:tRNA 2-selenouridine synthase